MNRNPATSCRRWLAAAVAACALHAAHAANSVMIWPVDPSIEDDQRATALWLENRGAETVSMQVRVFGWSQSGTEENFENQERIIASPPLAVIPAGQRQLVRLMNTAPVPDGKEQAYRVLVDELPESESASANPGAGNNTIGVKLQIRYSIPLFVHGKGSWTKPQPGRSRDAGSASRPELRWRTVQEGDTHYLVVRNSGNAHARLTSVQWVRDGAALSINPGLLGYVLPGSEMRWPLTAPPPAGHVPEARINGAETPQKIAPQ